MGNRSRRPAALVLGALVTALLSGLSPARTIAQAPPALAFRSDGPLSVDVVDGAVTALGTRRAELPAETTPDSPAELLKSEIDRRTSLLAELREILVERAALEKLVTDLPDLDDKLRAEREELAAERTAVVPASPSTEGLAVLRTRLVEQRREADLLRNEMVEAARRAAAADALETVQRQRKERATERAVAERELDAGIDVREREGRGLAVENARLEARLAAEALALLERQKSTASEIAEHRVLALEVAEQRVERFEVERELYRAALDATLAAEQGRKRAELDAKEAAATSAASPADRIVASWEVRIARIENSLPELESFELKLGKVVDAQESRLAEDRALLERLREYVEKYGAGGYTGEMIRNAFLSLRAKRTSLLDALPASLAEPLAQHRARGVEIEQTLLDLDEEWNRDYEAAAPSLSEYDRAALRAKRFPLRDGLRRVINAETAALDRIAALGQRLHVVVAEREQVVDELDVFIRTRVLWIRDHAMIDGSTIARAYRDVLRVSHAAAGAVHEESRSLAQSVRQNPAQVVYALLTVVVTIAIIRGVRVREARRRRRPAAQRASAPSALVDVLVDTLAVPAALLVIALGARLVDTTGRVALLPAGLVYIAAFAFLRALARELFADGGVGDRFGWLGGDARALLRRTSSVVLWIALVCLLPWTLVRETAPTHQALAGVVWTVFLLTVAIALWRVCRPGSPVIAAIVNSRTLSHRTILHSAWRVLLPAFVLAVPLLDAVGYSFTAWRLALAQVQSLAVFVLLVPAYRWTLGIARRSSGAQRFVARDAPALAPADGQRRAALVRMLFVVAGVLLLARIWGIDEQGWRTLETVPLYEVAPAADGTPQFATLGNVITALVVMLATVWLLRHLPGIYDLALFPRMHVDTGLRYAIVTISRYGLFFVGLMIAVRAVRFDMTSVGWLVAAMGVGLGFGLQEIVSNFVSGLILLVERPIRVDDLVTVGQITGRVQRINIRATTVVNFDRQEVIVPNRELITQDVINWTLADPVNRLVVKIGVEYGSDPNVVRECLREVALADVDVLRDPEPQILFVNHGESSLDFEVRVYLADPTLRAVALDRLNTAINLALAKKGIGIPFPQRDLHVKSWAPAAAPAKP